MPPTTPSHASKTLFEQHGLAPALVCAAENCSICLSPLARALPAGTRSKLSDAERRFLESGDKDILAFKQVRAAAGEPLDGAQPGLRLKACGHVFGSACIRNWLRERNSCPLCRRELFPSRKIGAVADVYEEDSVGVDVQSEGSLALEGESGPSRRGPVGWY